MRDEDAELLNGVGRVDDDVRDVDRSEQVPPVRELHLFAEAGSAYHTVGSTPKSAWYVTQFAPHQALKLTVWCKLTFDEGSVVHRVDNQLHQAASSSI